MHFAFWTVVSVSHNRCTEGEEGGRGERKRRRSVPDLGIWYLISRAMVILSVAILSQFSRIHVGAFQLAVIHPWPLNGNNHPPLKGRNIHSTDAQHLCRHLWPSNIVLC
jgi:hypothetical protein